MLFTYSLQAEEFNSVLNEVMIDEEPTNLSDNVRLFSFQSVLT